jgi:phage terminase large subunit
MRPANTKEVILSELVSWLPKQQQAYEAIWTHRYILYGGARGPGKSYFLRWSAVVYLVMQFAVHGLRGVRVGLFCETYRELQDRQIGKMKTEFPSWLGEVKDTKEDGLCFFLSERYGGGKIALRNLDDPTKYQSAEFAGIFIDELTKITRETFDILRGSLRWPGVQHTIFAAASNPGSIGHQWVKRLWIDRQFPEELKGRADEFIFIRALPADNPHLDKSYWDELDSLPEPLRSAWRDGNWDVFAGMAFSEWDATRHVVEPFRLPAWWPRWRALDWGYSAPFCCLWLARDPDTGRVYVYREAYQRELTDPQQARLIRELTPPDEQIISTYADPSMWARKTQEEAVTTTADIYAANQVYLTKADNDRLGGKRKINTALGSLPDGRPGLVIFTTCSNLVRTLPALPYDSVRVEDIDTRAEDHAYDALRYGLTNTSNQPRRQAQRTIPPLAMIGDL